MLFYYENIYTFEDNVLSFPGGKLQMLIQGLDGTMLEGVDGVKSKRVAVVSYFFRTFRSHNSYVYKFLFCEFLNLVNIIFQVRKSQRIKLTTFYFVPVKWSRFEKFQIKSICSDDSETLLGIQDIPQTLKSDIIMPTGHIVYNTGSKNINSNFKSEQMDVVGKNYIYPYTVYSLPGK